MIAIRSPRHAGLVLRHLRRQQHMTQRELAARLFVDHSTVCNRERGWLDLTSEALLGTARVLGFDVALVPARQVGRRQTGTGWPA